MPRKAMIRMRRNDSLHRHHPSTSLKKQRDSKGTPEADRAEPSPTVVAKTTRGQTLGNHGLKTAVIVRDKRGRQALRYIPTDEIESQG